MENSQLTMNQETPNQEVAIEVKNLTKIYTSENSFSKKENISTLALNNVSMNIKKGEIVGLVGESGFN